MTIDAPKQDLFPQMRSLWKQAFGDTDAFLDSFFATGFSPERCRCLLQGDRLAAVLYWFDCRWQNKKVAYLYAVATDEAFRNQGLCRTLMENTHAYLQSLGYAGTALVPGNLGLFAFYEKMGYLPFCPMKQVFAEASGHAVSVSPISPEVFWEQRKPYLPESALIPETDVLPFLASFSEFYTGKNALFCVNKEGDTVTFQEYWGDPGQIGGIVAALGGKTGSARIFPGDTPAAMYRALTADPAAPSYLGISLG